MQLVDMLRLERSFWGFDSLHRHSFANVMQLADILVRETRSWRFKSSRSHSPDCPDSPNSPGFPWERDATGRHPALKMRVLRVRISSLPSVLRWSSWHDVAMPRQRGGFESRTKLPFKTSPQSSYGQPMFRSKRMTEAQVEFADRIRPANRLCGSDATGRHP